MTNICLFLNKINKIDIKKKMQSCDFIFLIKSGKTKCDALIKRNVIFSGKTKCNKIKTHSTKEVDLKPIIKSTFSLYIKFKLHILISVK